MRRAHQTPLEQVDDLYCEILVDSIDPDGNSITYTFDWTVEGSTYNRIPAMTAYNGDTIPASETVAGSVSNVGEIYMEEGFWIAFEYLLVFCLIEISPHQI